MAAQTLFGFHAVGARLRVAAQSIHALYVDEQRRDARMQHLLQRATDLGIAPERCGTDRLTQLAGTSRHQGVVARAERLQLAQHLDQTLDALAHASTPALLLVLDGVTDPHNLGACLRVADAVGAHAVIAPKDHAVGINATVAKVASGAADTVPYLMVTNLARTLVQLRDQGIAVIGAADGASAAYTAIDATGPTAWVLGAEGKGLRHLTRQRCDHIAAIPMAGAVESLNVSVAAGVVLFEAARQRQQVKLVT
ncbi:MAG: 23S rRNA (guanosine(2251)-2'-O)-methyltransferase RlmB [Proteobacteria bacterium]|nr:23S rRNA (guanosine(2251)-2'-O)-methyltransferase RlmB [Pseudomonadota bacterium]MDA0868718.1 23S rRNA (guanosine(2251)-2'-O)-methyltransferase RlmB [Pseudomonadota bacterium]MDA1327880.1 23S rRNA (guanosine(2251)-2'-O)-methyltransferase RlmB [Pseudomonadota bacterium]